MNKMFSTLLAGAALFGAVSANAEAPAKDNLYQIKVGSKVLITQKTVAETADSLVMVAAPASNVSVTSVDFKKTLWKVEEVTVPNTSTKAFKMTNWATGTVLSLDLGKTGAKNGAIIASGKQANWFIGSDGKVTAISGGDTYSLTVADDKVTLEKKAAETAFVWTKGETSVAMEAADLNNLYGTSFVLDFDKDLDGNPIDGVALKAATGTTEGSVTLQVAGDKYLVVDSAVWTNSVNKTNYWKLATGAMPAKELTGDAISENIETATILENGRAKELYDFKVTLNIAAGYKLTITPAYLPKYANESAESGKQKVPSYDVVVAERALSYGKFATSKEVLTAPEKVTPADALAVATATFGVAEVPAAIDADYTYYVKYKNTIKADKKNKDLNKFAYLNCEGDDVAAAAASLEAPSYMWFITEDAQLQNMMNTEKTFTGAITLINEKEAIYAFGTDTIQLTKGPKVADAQKMGFKEVTKADEANGALSFRLVSALANDLYVVEKNGILYVANSELADAMKLKVVAFASDEVVTVGNDVVVPVYTIQDRLGKKSLVAGENGYELSAEGDAIQVAFMATGKENQYKIVLVGEGNAMETAITANAGSGILEEGAICADKNVTFEFAQKAAPTYGAPDYGHVKITTREDDGKFIAPQTDGFAALKAEGQILKSSYSSDTLTMWLDTASTIFDEVMPLYYISSNAFTPEAKNNERNYLINPMNISKAIDAANEEAEEAGEETVENVYPFLNFANTYKTAFKAASPCGSDSLAMAGDTINVMQLNPAAVAFEVAAEYGDEYYRIKSNLCTVNEDYDAETEGSLPYEETDPMYLAQLNNVLFWTPYTEDAEIFVINRASAPTANEGAIGAATITVLAKEGAVEVLGAAGKKVVVSNILGQVVANTVIASDAATIAVPAGVVVVAVEGEAAVKAIVK